MLSKLSAESVVKSKPLQRTSFISKIRHTKPPVTPRPILPMLFLNQSRNFDTQKFKDYFEAEWIVPDKGKVLTASMQDVYWKNTITKRNDRSIRAKFSHLLAENLSLQKFESILGDEQNVSRMYESKNTLADAPYEQKIAEFVNDTDKYEQSPAANDLRSITEMLEAKHKAVFEILQEKFKRNMFKSVETPGSHQKATFIEMLQSGCHLGQKSSSANPFMNQFAFCSKDGVHIFDITKQLSALRKIMFYLQEVVSEGGRIWFVGNDEASKRAAEVWGYNCDEGYISCPYVEGMLNEYNDFAKKYRGASFVPLDREDKSRSIEELKKSNIYRNLDSPPSTIVILNREGNEVLIKEALRRRVPTVGLCNSSTRTKDYTYVIPGNNKDESSVTFFMQMMSMAIRDAKDQMKYRHSLVNLVADKRIEEYKKKIVKEVRKNLPSLEGQLQVEMLDQRLRRY